MTLQDVIQFVSRNEGRWMPTVGGNARFHVQSAGNKAFVFTIESGKSRNESHDWIEKSLNIFNQTGSFKTSDYLTFNASYVLALFRQIVAESNGVEDLPPGLPLEELEILAAAKTEQVQLRKSRMGQGRFRQQLIRLRRSCYVTGLSEAAGLRASHIKSWKDSNNLERLDPYNGLLLTPNYDALFDAGYISFADDGRILISGDLSHRIITALGINTKFKGIDLGNRTKSYLEYHRAHKFRGKIPDQS